MYLGRKISDGRFFAIKICKSDSKLSQNEYNSMRAIQHQQNKFENKSNELINLGDLEIIPQIEEVRKQ